MRLIQAFPLALLLRAEVQLPEREGAPDDMRRRASLDPCDGDGDDFRDAQQHRDEPR
jgi:hypothetical protein